MTASDVAQARDSKLNFSLLLNLTCCGSEKLGEVAKLDRQQVTIE